MIAFSYKGNGHDGPEKEVKGSGEAIESQGIVGTLFCPFIRHAKRNHVLVM